MDEPMMARLSPDAGCSAPFQIQSEALGLSLRFRCAIELVGASASTGWGPWQAQRDDTALLVAECRAGDVLQSVRVVPASSANAVVVHHEITNASSHPISIGSVVTVDGALVLREVPAEAAYLHCMNTREEPTPVKALQPGEPSRVLGRVNYLFFEGLALHFGADRPAMVTGPASQRMVHRTQQLEWNGAERVDLRTMQELRGIDSKEIAAGESLELDGVFVQFVAEFEPNDIFTDYLATLRAGTPTRWQSNPLRNEHFFDPWNNFLYWEATEQAILDTARVVKENFPTVAWMGLDDGYQKAWVAPRLPRLPNGELDYHYDIEVVWWKNCPGVSFGFSEGLGEDGEKFPGGLLQLAQNIRALGLRPKLWVGLEISVHHPLCQKHPDWFLSVRNGEHALLDISVPAVREELERVFRTYFGRHGWEALKLDFWSHLFERPDLKYSQGNRTGAEWRAWFFEMLRRYVPDDGFISLGCDVAMGASWVAPWVDTYRCSNDMRDGDWNNVKGNVRWAMVPALTHGSGEPIADGDTLSIFKRLSASELQSWADYVHQTGGLVELGGNPANWNDEDKAWMRAYLEEPRGGGKCWYGDGGAWVRDGLPTCVYRERTDGAGGYVLTLHNWGEDDSQLRPADWAGPVRSCRHWKDTRSGEAGEIPSTASLRVPARSSRRLLVW
jgi:hypothetical protein